MMTFEDITIYIMAFAGVVGGAIAIYLAWPRW